MVGRAADIAETRHVSGVVDEGRVTARCCRCIAQISQVGDRYSGAKQRWCSETRQAQRGQAQRQAAATETFHTVSEYGLGGIRTRFALRYTRTYTSGNNRNIFIIRCFSATWM